MTPPKFNSSPLKNGGWKTILAYWVSVTFQGRAVKLREGYKGNPPKLPHLCCLFDPLPKWVIWMTPVETVSPKKIICQVRADSLGECCLYRGMKTLGWIFFPPQDSSHQDHYISIWGSLQFSWVKWLDFPAISIWMLATWLDHEARTIPYMWWIWTP